MLTVYGYVLSRWGESYGLGKKKKKKHNKDRNVGASLQRIATPGERNGGHGCPPAFHPECSRDDGQANEGDISWSGF